MYGIKDLATMCGLTERTIRNYLKMGVLKGEKKGGTWQFSTEQVEEFMSTNYVKSAIYSKNNAVISDYLADPPRDENSALIVLHLPKDDPKRVAAFFCEAVCRRSGLEMRFDECGGLNKVILTGKEETVFEIFSEYLQGK